MDEMGKEQGTVVVMRRGRSVDICNKDRLSSLKPFRSADRVNSLKYWFVAHDGSGILKIVLYDVKRVKGRKR
jgi:hypothetical protein